MYLIFDAEGTLVETVLEDVVNFTNILEVLDDANYSIYLVHHEDEMVMLP